MPRISLRCEVFQFFSDPFSGHVWSLSAFVCICKLFLNVLVFNVWFLKEEKKKKKFCGMGEQWSFKSLRSHFTSRGGVLVKTGEVQKQWLPASLSAQICL